MLCWGVDQKQTNPQSRSPAWLRSNPKESSLSPDGWPSISTGPIRTLLEALILSRGNQLLHITDYELHTLLHIVGRLHIIFFIWVWTNLGHILLTATAPTNDHAYPAADIRSDWLSCDLTLKLSRTINQCKKKITENKTNISLFFILWKVHQPCWACKPFTSSQRTGRNRDDKAVWMYNYLNYDLG